MPDYCNNTSITIHQLIYNETLDRQIMELSDWMVFATVHSGKCSTWQCFPLPLSDQVGHPWFNTTGVRASPMMHFSTAIHS